MLPPGTGSAAPASPALAGAVSPTPVNGTPTLVDTGTTEQIRQLVQCGGTMYAVGTFTEIKYGSTTYTRDNAFSFSATAPFAVTSWDPEVNGTVDTIAFNGSDCSTAYLGGHFSSVGGAAAKNIAAVDTTAGALVPGFKDNASGEVDTLAVANGHLLAGGAFKGINGSAADPYFASLSPATGRDDGFAHLNISGHYVFPGADSNPTKVYNQQISHGGGLDLVEGDFTSVGGQGRQQVFMLDLSGSAAQVTGWSSPEFDGSQGNLPHGYAYQCSVTGIVLYQGRGLVARRLDGLHRGDRLQPVELVDEQAADRPVRLGLGLPRHPGRGHPRVGQLHRLRLAVLGRRRLQRRLHRRPRALGGQHQRLQPPGVWCAARTRPGRLQPVQRGTDHEFQRHRRPVQQVAWPRRG